MIFFDQKFEYCTRSVHLPSNEEFDLDFDTKEYAMLRVSTAYFNLLLNELGKKGWELVDKQLDKTKSIDNDKLMQIATLTFKRSSYSNFYGKGEEIYPTELEKLAKRKVAEDYSPHGKLLGI